MSRPKSTNLALRIQPEAKALLQQLVAESVHGASQTALVERGIQLVAREIAARAAIENLRACQRQLDADGCEVGVSRQALDELLAVVG